MKRRASSEALEVIKARIEKQLALELERLEARTKAQIEKIRLKAELQLKKYKLQTHSKPVLSKHDAKQGQGAKPGKIQAYRLDEDRVSQNSRVREEPEVESDYAARLAEQMLHGKYRPKRADASRKDGHLVAELVVHMVRLPREVSALISDKIYESRAGQKLSFQGIAESALLEHMAKGGGFEEILPRGARREMVTHTIRLNPELAKAIQERVHESKRQGFRRASFQRLAKAAINDYLERQGWV